LSAGSVSELPKQYRPAEHEGRIWERWVASGAFHADPARVLRGDAKPYSIVMPPPNVTDRLHLGHALNSTLQDILARTHRMRGFETLWMPGTDHAGIATQAVVEKRVMKDEKMRRSQFSREDFVAKIQAFKDEYEAVITGQLKAMGCSCDWERQRFTMDEVCAKAVREAFFILFKDGLIYRGKRLVNWDSALQTAVADDECYDEEVDAAFYYLRYPLTAPATLADGTVIEHVTVATTRPETYLGDTAVAMSPKDPRAKSLVGLKVVLPLVGRVIPIIEDSYVVLPEAMATSEEEKNDPKAKFATGFLKVTPAHDQNDAEIGRRHELDAVNMMSPDGRISDKHGWSDVGEAGVFVGMKMADGRKAVVKEFESRGLVEAVKPYRHSIKFSDRSKAVIEPYLSDQWYVRVTDERLAKSANEALDSGVNASVLNGLGGSALGGTHAEGNAEAEETTLSFFPPRYAKTYEQWHTGIRDWCISRQLWWGHRIPVWTFSPASLPNSEFNFQDDPGAYFNELSRVLQQIAVDHGCGGSVTVHDGGWADDVRRYFVCTSSVKFGEVIEKIRREMDDDDPSFDANLLSSFSKLIYLVSRIHPQDPDVLDTWFSSALWPMSTMGWPDPAAAGPGFAGLLEAFNPTTTLCTAREIITLWVSRMVMFNRYFMGEGKGKGPVPFRNVFIHAVIQDGEGRKMSKSLGNGVDPLDIIASHGSDAMRFTLCQMTTQTQDVRLPVAKDSVSGRNTSPKFDAGRNFANKLWNAARFAIANLGEPARAQPVAIDDPSPLSLPDRWLLSRLAGAVQAADTALADFEYADYAQVLYDLLWRDFCDWYLEAIKPTIAADERQRAVLRTALDVILRLLHPVMPFVTEAIFENLASHPLPNLRGVTLAPPTKAGTLCTAGWPIIDRSLIDPASEASFETMRSLVTAIREVRALHNVQPKRKVVLHAPADSPIPEPALVATLAGLGQISSVPPPPASVAFAIGPCEFHLSDFADAVDSEAETARLTKSIADLERSIATLEGRLNNPGYALKAPPHMVQQTKDQLDKARAEHGQAVRSIGGPG